MQEETKQETVLESSGDNVVSRMYERDYSVELNDENRSLFMIEVSELDKQKSIVEDEKRKANAEFNEKIKAKDEAISKICEQVRANKKEGFGMVREVRNYSDCTVKTYIGSAWDQLIEERTMQGDEFQKDLFLRREGETEPTPATDLEAKGAELLEQAKPTDIRDVIQEETSSRTKHSAVDGPTP